MREIISPVTEMLKEKRKNLGVIVKPVKTGKSKYIFEMGEFKGYTDGRDKSEFYNLY